MAGNRMEQWPGLVAKIREMVSAGKLGYWLFVGEKREDKGYRNGARDKKPPSRVFSVLI